jgi:hypothetical protein
MDHPKKDTIVINLNVAIRVISYLLDSLLFIIEESPASMIFTIANGFASKELPVPIDCPLYYFVHVYFPFLFQSVLRVKNPITGKSRHRRIITPAVTMSSFLSVDE